MVGPHNLLLPIPSAEKGDMVRAAPAAHFGRIDAKRRTDGLVERGHASISVDFFEKKKTNCKVLPLYPFVHVSIYLYLVAVVCIRKKKTEKKR